MDWHDRRLAMMADGGPRPTYLADRFDRIVFQRYLVQGISTTVMKG